MCQLGPDLPLVEVDGGSERQRPDLGVVDPGDGLRVEADDLGDFGEREPAEPEVDDSPFLVGKLDELIDVRAATWFRLGHGLMMSEHGSAEGEWGVTMDWGCRWQAPARCPPEYPPSTWVTRVTMARFGRRPHPWLASTDQAGLVGAVDGDLARSPPKLPPFAAPQTPSTPRPRPPFALFIPM